MTNKKATPGKIFKKLECYSTNTAEMSKELRTVLIDPATDDFKNIPLTTATKAIQVAYNQLRETILECEGNEFVVPLPEGPAGVVLNLLLTALGIDLNAPVKPDSTVVTK
jgi:hypothetical protein